MKLIEASKFHQSPAQYMEEEELKKRHLEVENGRPASAIDVQTLEKSGRF